MNLRIVCTGVVTMTMTGLCFDAQAFAPTGDSAGSNPEPARWQREPSASCTTSDAIVTIRSNEVLHTLGLQYAQVQPGPLEDTLERNAELAYNANRYARLSSRAPGIVAEVLRDLGEAVKPGDVLAVIDSAELGAAKADLLQALETMALWDANARRERGLVEKGIGIEREALEAETRLAEARITVSRSRQRLRTLGLAPKQIEAVEQDADTSSLLSLTAPFVGIIVERSAVVGEVSEPNRPLLAIADTSLMWAMVDLQESDLLHVRAGQASVFTADHLPGRTFHGHLTWISTQVDPTTRTIKARVELDNGDGLLRANMFGRARISTGSGSRTGHALVIPKEAVQWEGCCNIAFVRDRADEMVFRPVRLTLAVDAGDRYAVAAGLNPGDTVVTRGSFILKNEILKSAVGAGCCEVDHLKK